MRIANLFGTKPLVLLLVASVGAALGVGLFTFGYAKGGSYITDDPAACTNCHVMQTHYDGWMKSGHRHVAVCNDCHTPASLIPKYLVKAENGFWHSYYFTTGGHDDVIRAHARSRRVVEDACRRCHQDITEHLCGAHLQSSDDAISCVRCHRDVGHPR